MSLVNHNENCKNILLITDFTTGEVACKNCGSVIIDRAMETGHDGFRGSSEEFEQNTRVGAPVSLRFADKGLPTIIQKNDKDASGNKLTRENKRIFHRLRLWDRNSKSVSHNKSFHKAFTLLDSMRSKLGLPEQVAERSAYLFRKVAAKKILLGRSTTGMLCAIVYITCRMSNTPRTIQDVADAGNVKRKYLQRIYRMLLKELEISPESFGPKDFVNRISNEAKLSEKTRRYALEILELGSSAGFNSGKNPIALAASAVYVSALENGEKISQLMLSEISGISAVTIRERGRFLKKFVGEKHGKNM